MKPTALFFSLSDERRTGKLGYTTYRMTRKEAAERCPAARTRRHGALPA
jgi:hypothetical protein